MPSLRAVLFEAEEARDPLKKNSGHGRSELPGGLKKNAGKDQPDRVWAVALRFHGTIVQFLIGWERAEIR
jgi:hypothetical protein